MHVIKRVFSEIQWVTFVIGRKVKRQLLVLRRLLIKPQLPQNQDGKVLIHLGCGDIASPEFINIDAIATPHVHYVRDVSDLSIFPDNHADLVYACHLLEHIDHSDMRKVLWEWKRVLKVGGVLRVSVPDFDRLIELYEAGNRNVEIVRTPLLGRWEGYRSHVTLFNYDYLSQLLLQSGFSDIHCWAPSKVQHHNFEDWASRTVPCDGKEYCISLNIEGTK